MFFEHVVRLDDQHRSCSFETNTAFDTDNGITHMHITTDCIRSSNSMQSLNGSDAVIVTFAVQSNELALLESQGNPTRFSLFEL